MELSESDVCKLAIRLASKEDKKTLLELLDKAGKKDKILQERLIKGFLPFDEGGVELPEQEERKQIIDDVDKSRRILNSFCETIIRRALDAKNVDNKDENNGGANTSKDDERELLTIKISRIN